MLWVKNSPRILNPDCLEAAHALHCMAVGHVAAPREAALPWRLASALEASERPARGACHPSSPEEAGLVP